MLTITEESKEIEHLETDLRRQTQQDDFNIRHPVARARQMLGEEQFAPS